MLRVVNGRATERIEMWSERADLMAFVPVTDMARVDEFDRPPHTVLGWSVDSITESIQALTTAGVAFHRHDGMGQDEQGIWVAPSQDRVAWFSDSEGNTLSLTQPA
jgi:predicted enzyme related to lactoylglutathione lyase